MCIIIYFLAAQVESVYIFSQTVEAGNFFKAFKAIVNCQCLLPSFHSYSV